MNTVVVKAPAKINLTLDITGKRDDGYHLMKMVMQSVDLYDTISLKKQDYISLTCDRKGVPEDDKNLAWRAAEAFFAHNNMGEEYGVEIIINKVIPMEAGLAGGSADAAGVLCGLNKLYETNLSTKELCELGLTIGADVPFCIVGATAVAEGIGEILTPVPPMPDCSIVIAKPSEGMNTAECFKRFDSITVKNRPDADAVISAVINSDIEEMAKGMYNVLEEVSTLEEINTIKKDMFEHGALHAMMTGSGTAVFGIFDNRSKAKKCLKHLMGYAASVFLSRPCDHGPVILNDEDHDL